MQKLKDIGAAPGDAAGTAAFLHGEGLWEPHQLSQGTTRKGRMVLLARSNAKETVCCTWSLQIEFYTVEATSDLLPDCLDVSTLKHWRHAKKVVEIPAELSSAVAATEADEDTLTGAAWCVVGNPSVSGCQCCSDADVLRTCNYLKNTC
jgi:hypothetical protein